MAIIFSSGLRNMLNAEEVQIEQWAQQERCKRCLYFDGGNCASRTIHGILRISMCMNFKPGEYVETRTKPKVKDSLKANDLKKNGMYFEEEDNG